tara:strand:+ start:4386 stop:4916 length:531 start_codon:yes stop_codon:yes gene_type:complete
MDNETKKISITGKNNKYKLKKASRIETENGLRSESIYWGASDNDLDHDKQVDQINSNNTSSSSKLLEDQIKKKISKYKQQDKYNSIFNINEFVTYEYVIKLLKESKLLCKYCSNQVYVLYRNVRFDFQWTLDRINNSIGHNINNVYICCLKCNLERKNINMEMFKNTKNMIIKKNN